MDNDLPYNDDDDEDKDQPVILLYCSNGAIFKKTSES